MPTPEDSNTQPIEKNKKKNTPLYTHYIEKHSNDQTPPDFSMKVSGIFHGDALKRQIAESIQIEKTPGIINRRDEFRQFILPRVEIASL